MAAISTLLVSICYLIPQMVGAGVLVTPLLGLPHRPASSWSALIVITIVATAGMTSTTYVQFIKGGLLLVFSLVLVIVVLFRGLSTQPDQGGRVPFREYRDPGRDRNRRSARPRGSRLAGRRGAGGEGPPIRQARSRTAGRAGGRRKPTARPAPSKLLETQFVVRLADGTQVVNGAPASQENALSTVGNMEAIAGQERARGRDRQPRPGQVPRPHRRFPEPGQAVEERVVRRRRRQGDGLLPGPHPATRSCGPARSSRSRAPPTDRIDFLSLMLALFLGTAALPHILIRYYTVPSPASARKSTIVAIAAIGFFYILTLFMGLGAMINGVVNLARRQHVGSPAGPLLRHVPVRHDLGHRLRDRPGHGQRPDHRRLRRGGP